MHEHRQPKAPKDLSGYLDAMARVMFQTGLSWRVVEAKWPGLREAFRDFDPERVARLKSKDIDKLMGDTRVIRNRKKLEAIVSNAGHMLELNAEYKGFKKSLDSLGDFDSTRKALHKEFAYMGDAGSWFFLWSVGRKVPEHEGM